MSELTISDNQAESRIETSIDGHLARIDYLRNGNEITFTHTFVPEELGGRGIAGHLAQYALELSRSEALAVIPQCPYIAKYIQKHPEFQDLVKA